MPTLTSYQSGIDLVLTGTEGTDYAVERHCHDERMRDIKVVFLKGDTPFGFAHNARNMYGTVSTNLAPGGYPGVIKYLIDRDRWYPSYLKWVSTHTQTYSTALTFDALEYEAGVDVLGTTGPKPGIALNEGTRATYYHRGIIGPDGNEWHIVTVGDDDSTKVPPVGGEGFNCSDGKVFFFVTNPQTPCLSISVTGNAQFITTTPKAYFNPIIHQRRTYILPRTGTVSITLTDINGNNVFYRIVSSLEDGATTYTDAGASTVTLDDGDFATGVQYLQYYYTGHSATPAYRMIEKNPAFPSTGETHGNAMWGSGVTLNDIKAKITSGPCRTQYEFMRDKENGTGFPTWDDYESRGFGERMKSTDPLPNAFVAAVNPTGWTYVKPQKTKSYANYAKEKLLFNPRCMDPVGFEQNHVNNNYPCRELHDRGYRNANPIFSSAFAYDLLISEYRSDNGYADGITPIEDYHIRESLASFAFECAQWLAGVNTQSPGMWGYARCSAALSVAICMPSYNTPWYGTSGVDGTAATYYDCPFPDVRYTWKQLFSNPSVLTVTAYPNLKYNDTMRALCDASHPVYGNNHWDDVGSYAAWGTAGAALEHHMIMNAVHFGVYDSDMVACANRMAEGSMRASKKEPTESTPPFERLRRYTTLLLYNNFFPSVVARGLAYAQSLTSGDQTIGSRMAEARVMGIVHYDANATGDVIEFAPAFTLDIADQTVDEGDDVTFTVTVTGTPTPTLAWFKNDAPYPNDGATLILHDVTTAAAGAYYVVATNSVGQTSSTTAVLTVNGVVPPGVPTTFNPSPRTAVLALP